MTTFTAKILQEDFSHNQERLDGSEGCALKWRCRQLSVRRSHQFRPIYLPALENEQWLAECLQNSSVRLIRIEPELGETKLKFWASACAKANKPLFLRLSPARSLPGKRSPLLWRLKRLMDWIAAAVLLLVLSPFMLGLMALVRSSSPGPVFFTQWRVGERGKLFRIFKFRTMVVGAETLHHQVMGNQTGLHKREDDFRITPVGRFLRKYSLDELPQLFNVLRGEMSLVGPRPWALYDALRLSKSEQRRLNALPGITGDWQVKARSHLLDLEAVTRCDLEYLHDWSVWRDVKILLMTIPKVLSGVGAY